VKHLARLTAVLAVLSIGVIAAAANAQEKVQFLDSAKAESSRRRRPARRFAVVWGDMDKGPFGAFVKFEPGAKFEKPHALEPAASGGDQGAYIYAGANGVKHRVGPGCFLSTPAGDHHVSSGDPKLGALFYMESNGKFDLVPDKK